MPPDQILPFYSDWKFWSFAVAFLALALSQLPPIYLWFRRAKLDAEVYSLCHVTHKVGNPNIQIHMILSNTGGRQLRVRTIEIDIRRGDQDTFVLPAKTYLLTPSDKEALLLTPFKLKPGEDWAHMLNFLNYFSREDDRRYRQLEATLTRDIIDKRVGITDENENVAADEANVQPLLKFYDERFKWHHGEYELTLRVKTEPPNVMKDKRFRMTLFESDSTELASYRDDYKFGFGVSLVSPRHRGIIVPLTEA